MSKKNKIYSDAGSLTAVRRELMNAKYADVVAVQMSLKNFWRPLVLWRAVKFIFRNQKRQRLLAKMSRAKMGFNWRDARPLKLQRKLGLKPQL